MPYSQLVRFCTRCRLGTAGTAVAAALAATAAMCLPVAAEAQTKVRYVEVVRNLAYLPSYIAFAKGFLQEEGIEASLSTAQGGDKATAQILSGHADITLVGPETAIYVQNSASPEKMIIFCSLTGTSTNFFVSRKPLKSGKFDWSTIKGQTVLGWRPGSTPELFMEWAMKKNGIDPVKDIDNITNIGVPARMGAWLSGKGDFGIFSEPEVTRLEADGKAYVATFVGNHVGQVDYTLFMATDSYIRKNPQTVQAWTNAIYKAQRFTASADPKELAALVKRYFPAVTEQQIVSAVNRYRTVNLWRTDPVVYEKPMQQLQEILIAGGVQKPDQRVKYEQIVNASFAEKAKAAVK
jgi:NitT/TauT family transport system substrate-binding protein